MTPLSRYGLHVFVFTTMSVGTTYSPLRAERYAVMADTRIDSRTTDQNFGSDTILRLVKNSETDRDGSLVRGLLRLDLPDLAREEVAEARLWITLTRVRGPEGYDPYSREVVVRPLTNGFAELGATWNERDLEQQLLWDSPGGDFSLDPALRISWQPPQGIEAGIDGTYWCSWDLLPLWNDSNLRNHGVMLTMDPETPPDTSFLTYAFASREFTSDQGDYQPYVEVTLRHLAGDFNGDKTRSHQDIDLLWAAVRAGTNDATFDLNEDALVNATDSIMWVEQLAGTYFGDANLDGEFNSGDLVDVFQTGEYEDGVPGNSGWANGDWNGSADFDSADFVRAFQGSGYESGPRVDTQAVPEPGFAAYWLLGVLVHGLCRGRRMKR